MRYTSTKAYKELSTGNISQRQKQVLESLGDIYPACNRQVSEYSHLPINVVTPRMGELVLKGKVEEAFRGKDPKTGKRVIFWRPALRQPTLEFGDTQ
jgi:hypothetical protein